MKLIRLVPNTRTDARKGGTAQTPVRRGSSADETEKGRMPEQAAPLLPLVVDLDGTLVKSDLLIESFFSLLKKNPLYIVLIPFWLVRGRAYMKRRIGEQVDLDVDFLPYNADLLDYLKGQRAQGRELVLATGSDEGIARRVADFLGLFDGVLASNGVTNLTGRLKRDRLVAMFGEKGFDYAANDRRDKPVWSSAHRALVVGSSHRLLRMAGLATEVDRVFRGTESRLQAFVRALRLHHWLKNLLVFVPLLMAQRFTEAYLLVRNFLAFLAFGLCASSVYLVNDAVDLPADRRHPWKRHRPFASGELPLVWGMASIPLLLGSSLLVSLLLPRPFLGVLVIYYLLTLGYSFTLKRVAMLDVIVLAGLYTVRVMAGSASIGIWPSSWLLAFSTFLFLSLALVKRYAELLTMSGEGGEEAQVRGYNVLDRDLLSSMGTGSGYLAVLVLVIYISSGAAEIHYSRHQFIWLLCPLLLYWISYVWLTAHRGAMHDDPLVFTTRDRISRIVILLAVLILALAM